MSAAIYILFELLKVVENSNKILRFKICPVAAEKKWKLREFPQIMQQSLLIYPDNTTLFIEISYFLHFYVNRISGLVVSFIFLNIPAVAANFLMVRACFSHIFPSPFNHSWQANNKTPHTVMATSKHSHKTYMLSERVTTLSKVDHKLLCNQQPKR